MNSLHLALEAEDGKLPPGATMVVNASWELDDDQELVELRMFWYTRGKGDTDMHIVETLPFARPQRRDSVRLGIQLPSAPYSFSGKLISLIWALELVAEPSHDASRLEFVMAPDEREILLHEAAAVTESDASAR